MTATTYPKRPWSGQRRGYPQAQTQAPSAPIAEKATIKGPKNLWLTLQVITKGKVTSTTKAMRLPGGVLIRTATVGQIFSSEALCFVPGVDLMTTADGGGAIVARAEGGA